MFSTWDLPPSKDSELPMRMRTFLSFRSKGGKGGRFWQIGLKPRCGVVTWTGYWSLMLWTSFLTSPNTIVPWGVGVNSIESESRLPGPAFQPLCWLTQALHFSALPGLQHSHLEGIPRLPGSVQKPVVAHFTYSILLISPLRAVSHKENSVFVYWCWLFPTSCLSCYVSQADLHHEAILLLPPECWIAALYHRAWPWDPGCCSSVFWLTAVGACMPEGSLFTDWRNILSCTSISVDYLELRLFLFVYQICLPLLIPRWWSSQPTLWVVLNPTFMPCKAMWTCSELLSPLWDITVNMLSCLLHLNQVKALFKCKRWSWSSV